MRRWVQTQYAGDEKNYTFDMSDMASDESATVSSVTASSVGDVACEISNTDLSSGGWSGDVLTNYPGRAMVKLLATFSNGLTRVRTFEIDVKGAAISQVSGGLTAFDITTG